MKIRRENYITIQGWMTTELGLKGNELLIYAIIYGFSQNNGNEFNGSLQYLADWTCTTKKSAFNNVNSLLEKGLIEKTEVFKGSAKYCTYKVTCQDPTVENVSNCRSKNYHGTVENFTTNNTNNNSNNNRKKKKEFTPPTLEEVEAYCKERKNNVDAKRFIDYYSVDDWKDKNGKPVRNWKQKMISVWEKDDSKNNYQSNPIPQQPTNPYKSYAEIKKEQEEQQKRWELIYGKENKGN